VRPGLGDVLHLEGEGAALRGFVEDGGLMALTPMARREARSFSPTPVLAFGLGILATALGIAPPEIAFGAVVVALAAGGAPAGLRQPVTQWAGSPTR
jgi:hypothetical protein